MREGGDPTSSPSDQGLSWLALLYGLYLAAIDAARSDMDVEIAMGIEMMLIATLDFVWARARVSLGAALVVCGLSAPVIAFGSAPLFWYEVHWFYGEAWWTAMIGGATVAVPLVFLGRRVLTRAVTVPKEPDPPWFPRARWALRGGLWLCVLAFRLGDFELGTVLVYVGAALTLVSLGIALPRRIHMGRGGVGKLMIFFGVGALFVTLVAGALVGGHMSADEALLGIVPSLLVTVVGSVLVARGR